MQASRTTENAEIGTFRSSNFCTEMGSRMIKQGSVRRAYYTLQHVGRTPVGLVTSQRSLFPPPPSPTQAGLAAPRRRIVQRQAGGRTNWAEARAGYLQVRKTERDNNRKGRQCPTKGGARVQLA